jgi:2,5-diamino-6-(ribosylamino)-4(3H)-pyrimidinone 5'-phosphate reductase
MLSLGKSAEAPVLMPFTANISGYMNNATCVSARPTVLIVSEITVDGRLTICPGCSSKELMQFMSDETTVLLHRVRAECDAIMVGANTIRIDDSFLTVRHVPGTSPIRVVPSSRCDLSPKSNVFSPDARTIVATTHAAPKDAVEALRNVGAEIVFAGVEKVDLMLLLNILYTEYNISKLMLEGGARLNGQMFSLNLVDKMILIHMPFIVGGADTPDIAGSFHSTSIHDMIRLNLDDARMCGSNLVTEYTIVERT